MNNQIAAAIKKFKTAGIIVSILLIIGGILILSTPIGSGIAFAWAMLITLLINGVYRLIRYFMLPKEVRNGWMLADGIISTLFSVLILIDITAAPFGAALGIIAMLGYLVGFYEIFTGINQLCSISAVKAAGGSYGWMIFAGVLNLICGIFVVGHPIISYFALEWILAIYLLIFGITTLIECVCVKAKKD